MTAFGFLRGMLIIFHSNDIMQHLAESCRNRNSHHVGTDDRRMASYGSTIAIRNAQDDPEAAQNDYDSIEAEIDQLKDDVLKLRTEADKGRTEPKTEQELVIEKFLSTRSGRKQALINDRTEESAAMRLQRLHEENKNEDTKPLQQLAELQVPPSPLDFPALGESTSSSRLASPTDSECPTRKTSYAHAATSGMMEALDHAFSTSGKPRSNSKLSDSTSNDRSTVDSLATTSTASLVQASSTAATQDSQEANEEEHSVIVTSEYVSTDAATVQPPNITKEKPASPNVKTMRQSPRFAKPTESFARRAGETLRRESASASPKSPAEGSPAKSVKAKEPDLATTKRAFQQQKRKSLPGDWLKPSGLERPHAVEAASKVVHHSSSAANLSSAASAGGKQAVESSNTKENGVPTKLKTKETQPQSPLRNKTSSYMAPTSAATQRTIATLGADKSKREPSQAKPKATGVDANELAQQIPSSPRPTTASSDSSSVHFILDCSPRTDSKVSPHRIAIKPHPRGEVYSLSKVHGGSFPSMSSARSELPRQAQQTSPTKLPKPSPLAARQARYVHARNDSRSSDGLAALPNVANTTTKRRTSHGHLLAPIVARLDAKGLLNKSPTKIAAVEAYLQSTSGNAFGNEPQSTREALAGSGHRSEAVSGCSIISQEDAPPRKIVPPHLRRSREASTASTSTDATLCQEHVMGMTLPRQDATTSLGISHGGQSTNLMGKPSTTPSLRATAAEFKPLQSFTQKLPSEDWPGPLEFIPEDEWATIPTEIKMKIQAQRLKQHDTNRIRGWLSTSTFQAQRPSPPGAPLKHGVHRSLGDLMSLSGRRDSGISFIDNNGSPHVVQAGQVLKPSLSPGKKTVQWMLQDVDGKETSINFGRAPAPEATPLYEPLTPTISSASDNTSPLKTPHSLRGWHIGSAYSRNPYGWAGGDGKEIRFVGYGPYAERDPNSTVNFNFQGRTSSFGASVPNGFNEDKENFESTEYVAPRSRRQWAEKLGYHKVPCGNVEITHSVEQMPFGSSQLAAYCHDCMAR